MIKPDCIHNKQTIRVSLKNHQLTLVKLFFDQKNISSLVSDFIRFKENHDKILSHDVSNSTKIL